MDPSARLRTGLAYVTELPPLPRPRVTQYRVSVCRCAGCARPVRGEQPDLALGQYGATAHRLGPRALAAAHDLHYQAGVPVCKVPLVLGLLTGLELTQGAITHSPKPAEGAGPEADAGSGRGPGCCPCYRNGTWLW